MLQHLLCVEIGDQERDIVSLNWFPSQNDEALCSLLQEPCKFVDQDVLDFVCLLDLNAYTDTVDTGLDENALILVARDGEWVEDDFR